MAINAVLWYGIFLVKHLSLIEGLTVKRHYKLCIQREPKRVYTNGIKKGACRQESIALSVF